MIIAEIGSYIRALAVQKYYFRVSMPTTWPYSLVGDFSYFRQAGIPLVNQCLIRCAFILGFLMTLRKCLLVQAPSKSLLPYLHYCIIHNLNLVQNNTQLSSTRLIFSNDNPLNQVRSSYYIRHTYPSTVLITASTRHPPRLRHPCSISLVISASCLSMSTPKNFMWILLQILSMTRLSG